MVDDARSYLGRILVDQKIITQEQLDAALKEQKSSHEQLGIVLLRLGFIKEDEVFLNVLANHLDVEFINLRSFDIDQDIINKIPPQFATHYKIIPMDFSNDILTVASVQPQDINVIDGINLICVFCFIFIY